MRVAVYNQMFGLDGRSFFKSIIGHYYIHYQKDSRKVLSRVNLNENLRLVEESNADVIGLCEIYSGTEEEVKSQLKRLGYKYIYFGKGHRFKFNNHHVVELIASKYQSKQIKIKNWPLKNTLGGGGGFVACKFKDFTIFHVHLALPTRGFFNEQIEYLQRIIKKTDGKIILMGDFNLTHNKLKKYFSNFVLATKGIKTCSLTPIMGWFYNKDVDHIFVKGFEAERIGVLKGRSDHKLIYADLK
ncbi:MAG: endonuclease/exonuclease/phosphatase family protein [Nanoarchaeota archaeon]|nr:endonuclease/exonuclease/phosphatase family protein [Nanoarchaeota archaeon]